MMKLLLKKSFYLLLGALYFLTGAKVEAYSYGPTCQWFRLVGSIENPTELADPWPLYLTVQYRSGDEESLKLLLTNYPLKKEDFVFVLAGFEEEMNEVIFLPIRLSFENEIEFIYWVESKDGHWRSETQSSFYKPLKIKKGEEHLCQTRIELKGLSLKSHLIFD